MKAGEQLRLTDGQGLCVLASISDPNKKRCIVEIVERKTTEPEKRRVQIAISLLKNAARFEWFLEKATELGVSDIIPLRSARTEKQQYRLERMKGILESALIQSQQSWMPVLHEPQNFLQCIENYPADQKFIAHCEPGEKKQLSEMMQTTVSSQLILIGPEGDFTEEEIRKAMNTGFTAVGLGDHRLRSETAAMAAAAVLKLSYSF
jgi:16S rRNA (uracil1498-N3)-methyltransferase